MASIFILCILTTGVIGGPTPTAIDAVSDVRLVDQFGDLHSLVEHRGRITVVMVVTVKRLRNIKAWEKSLRDHFDDLDFVRVADVPSDSAATLESVANKLVERVPEGVPVLIDIERHWATDLALDTDRPNLLIVDRDGRLVSAFRGLCAPELLAPVVHTIESVVAAP